MKPQHPSATPAQRRALDAIGAGIPGAPRQRRADTRQRGLFDGDGTP